MSFVRLIITTHNFIVNRCLTGSFRVGPHIRQKVRGIWDWIATILLALTASALMKRSGLMPRAPGATARAGFGVTQILTDTTSVINGIAGKTAGGEDESFTADLIVGADGRFSFAPHVWVRI